MIVTLMIILSHKYDRLLSFYHMLHEIEFRFITTVATGGRVKFVSAV